MPLWILLIPYALFLLIFGVFSLIDLYHAVRFRSGFFSGVFLVLFYLAGTAGILYLTATLLLPLDWSAHIGPELTSFKLPFNP
jgi:hypothetical protein